MLHCMIFPTHLEASYVSSYERIIQLRVQLRTKRRLWKDYEADYAGEKVATRQKRSKMFRKCD